ncbi:MAG: DUF1385 domain-containing protein [Clostridiales Family XIII bacterium]|nr:DUF1385 domain-containing protein [Clostridiales Family XIII bacterium]
MMKGEDRTALVVRLGDGSLYASTKLLPKPGKWRKVPIVRGVLVFVDSLVTGVRTLMQSAELLEASFVEDGAEGGDEGAGADGAQDSGMIEETRFTRWLTKRFGEDAPMRFALFSAVAIAIAFTVGIFIILPTLVLGLLGSWVTNEVALNLIEGAFRIALFVAYIFAVSHMKDIRTVFRFHGAEHKCIHCYESGLPLEPSNCQRFETLHPRCGTSFLMFVMIIALLLFSLLGWPNPALRVASRLVLVPVIAGLSYELLRWAGNSTAWIVKVLSVPGLLLQKLTTREPDTKELEVAIAAMHAVLVPKDTPVFEGACDHLGRPLPEPAEEDAGGGAGEDASLRDFLQTWRRLFGERTGTED